MELKLNSTINYPEEKLIKAKHFLQASSVIIGKHRYRS